MRRVVTSTVKLGLLLGVAIAVVPVPTLAQSCRTPSPTPASTELQTFDVEALGLTLNIPSNYRSVLRVSGHITFHDPNSFAFIQCLVRTGEYGEVPPYVALEVHKQVDRTSPLLDLVRERRPWLDYYNPEYQPITFASQESLQYVYFNEIYQLEIANVSFLAPDGSTLLTLTGPVEHPIMVNALSITEPVVPLTETGSEGR